MWRASTRTTIGIKEHCSIGPYNYEALAQHKGRAEASGGETNDRGERR